MDEKKESFEEVRTKLKDLESKKNTFEKVEVPLGIKKDIAYEKTSDIGGFLNRVIKRSRAKEKLQIQELGIAQPGALEKSEMAVFQQGQKPPEEKEKSAMQKDFFSSIGANLKKIAGDIGKSIHRQKENLKLLLILMPTKTIKTKQKLVLPNLPINEQINELNQIVFGLINGEFNKEEIEIIKREVEGLYVLTKNEKPPQNLSESERNLVEIRNNYLERARKLLAGVE